MYDQISYQNENYILIVFFFQDIRAQFPGGKGLCDDLLRSVPQCQVREEGHSKVGNVFRHGVLHRIYCRPALPNTQYAFYHRNGDGDWSIANVDRIFHLHNQGKGWVKRKFPYGKTIEVH